MSDSDKVCPACGSDTLTERIESQILKEPFGGQKEVPVKEYYCSTCKSKGDFFNENDNVVENALESLKAKSIINILNYFSDNKISMSAMERVLSLPQRTLAKWKNGAVKPSSSGIALMKFLRTFPWLLEVAENKFDYNIAQNIYITTAIQKFLNSVKFDSKDFTKAGIMATSPSKVIFLYVDRQLDHARLPDDNQTRMLEVSSQVLTTTE